MTSRCQLRHQAICASRCSLLPSKAFRHAWSSSGGLRAGGTTRGRCSGRPGSRGILRHQATEDGKDDRDTAGAPGSNPEQQKVAPKVEGQTTAIVTGAVSIAFGVVYLLLVYLLDTRGSELRPPPPEAFGL